MPHYTVGSEVLDTRVFVFNSPDKATAQREALNLELGERLDRLFDGDANMSPDYDENEDLTVEEIAPDGQLTVIAERDV